MTCNLRHPTGPRHPVDHHSNDLLNTNPIQVRDKQRNESDRKNCWSATVLPVTFVSNKQLHLSTISLMLSLSFQISLWFVHFFPPVPRALSCMCELSIFFSFFVLLGAFESIRDNSSSEKEWCVCVCVCVVEDTHPNHKFAPDSERWHTSTHTYTDHTHTYT